MSRQNLLPKVSIRPKPSEIDALQTITNQHQKWLMSPIKYSLRHCTKQKVIKIVAHNKKKHPISKNYDKFEFKSNRFQVRDWDKISLRCDLHCIWETWQKYKKLERKWLVKVMKAGSCRICDWLLFFFFSLPSIFFKILFSHFWVCFIFFFFRICRVRWWQLRELSHLLLATCGPPLGLRRRCRVCMRKWGLSSLLFLI